MTWFCLKCFFFFFLILGLTKVPFGDYFFIFWGFLKQIQDEQPGVSKECFLEVFKYFPGLPKSTSLKRLEVVFFGLFAL